MCRKEPKLARRYVNPAGPATPVTDPVLAEARAKADAAAARLCAAELADPEQPGWDAEYGAAAAAAHTTGRRVEAVERLRAAQVERSGARAAAVKAADLEAVAAGLSASRDQLGAAAAGHLRALAGLATAADAHNVLLAQSRARLAELGLRVRDELVDVDAGQEHAEGVLDGPGVRAGGIDWRPVPAPGIAAHALRLVFRLPGLRGPFAATRYTWGPHQVESRPDGLKVPSLEDAGATLPPEPPRVLMPSRPSIGEVFGDASVTWAGKAAT